MENPQTTRRYCPDGHIYQTAPEFQPCCPKARPAPKERTHCPQGHEYTRENTLWYRGQRYCRVCRRQRNRRRGRGRLPSDPQKRWLVRSFVKLRDKGLCRYCGRRGSEVDHVVPRCNKGKDHAFDNLVWSCQRCNSRKGREAGFTMKKERLYWHNRLVAPGSIFGVALFREVEAQRLERQVASGLTGLVEYKQSR